MQGQDIHVVVDATEYSISLFLQGDEVYLTFSELSWGVSESLGSQPFR